jgi:hypothetical protein
MVQDMILNFYRKVGEPTDLSPYTYVAEVPTYDTASAGWTACLGFLNRAYAMLANWKTPNGRIVRFREHNETFLWSNTDSSTALTCSAIDSSGKVLTFAGAAFTANLYRMWYININGFKSMIISNTADTITVKDATTLATVSGYAGTLYKRFFPLMDTTAEATASGIPAGQYVLPPTERKIISFQRIVNLTLNNQEVFPADRTQLFWDLPAVRTYPMQYRYTDQGLEFEHAPPDGTLFRILYYGEPEQLTTDTQVPDVPAAWHEVIWMIAAWLRKTIDQNSEEASIDLTRINATIAARVQEYERDLDEQNVGVYSFY